MCSALVQSGTPGNPDGKFTSGDAVSQAFKSYAVLFKGPLAAPGDYPFYDAENSAKLVGKITVG